MEPIFAAKPNLEKTIMFNVLLSDDTLKNKARLLLQTQVLLDAETSELKMNYAELEEDFDTAIEEYGFHFSDLFNDKNSSVRDNVIHYEKLIVDSKGTKIAKLEAEWEKNKEGVKKMLGVKNLEEAKEKVSDPLDDLPEFKNVRIVVLYTHSGGHLTIGSNEPETSWSVDDIIQLLKRAAGTSVKEGLHAILLGCNADIFMRQVKKKLDPHSEKYTFYAYVGETYTISNKYEEVIQETKNIKVLLD